MTYAQVVTQVKRMSQAEKLALMRVLADSLAQETLTPKRRRTLHVLYGALRPKHGRIPTNKRIRKDYHN